MRRWVRALVISGSVACCALFAWAVWPSPYRYFTSPPMPPGAVPVLLVRVNRFTGSADRLSLSGWSAMPRPPEKLNPFADLGELERRQNPLDLFLDSVRVTDSTKTADSLSRIRTGRLRPSR